MAKTTDTVLLQRMAAVENRVTAVEVDVLALEAQAPTDLTEVNAKLDALKVTTDAIKARVDALSSGGGTGGGGTAEPPPADANTYPLRMPTDVAVGASIVLGTGPDNLSLSLGTSYGIGEGLDPANWCSVAILIDKKLIAGPLTVSGTDLSPQNFTIRGSWGPLPHVVLLSSGGERVGMSGLAVKGVMYNFLPLRLIKDTVADSRGSVTPAGSLGVWDNMGVPLEFGDVPPPVPPPPPPPTLVQDLINGKTLQALADETPSGGTLILPEGTFHAEAKTRLPMTVRGAGAGKTILTGEGGWLANGKGILNALADLTVEDLTLTKAAVADHNGAGVRPEPGANLVMRNVEVSFCENGLLTPSDGEATVLIEDSSFHDNGYGRLDIASATHQVYIGRGCAKFTALGSIFTCNEKSTHAVKSRARITEIIDSHLTGNGDDGSVGGAVLNTPDGGEVFVKGTTLKRISGAGNTQFLAHATEDVAWGVGSVMLDGVVAEGGGEFETLVAGPLTIVGSTYVGSAPTFAGWSSVTGQFSAA